jgi:hypothetical protein
VQSSTRIAGSVESALKGGLGIGGRVNDYQNLIISHGIFCHWIAIYLGDQNIRRAA